MLTNVIILKKNLRKIFLKINNENISENIISDTKKEPSSEDPLAF